MKKFSILFFLCLLVFNTIEAQVKYENFDSPRLGQTRQIKIQLPRNYNNNPDKNYPLIVVFDADYLFEAVAGNADYYAYWEDMPESIVIGINQIGTRYYDTLYSEQNAMPIETGAAFFEFIGMELIPYIEKTYRTANFRVAVGHGQTANFINYYLLKSNPLFQGYVVISPELAPNMLDYIPEKLSKADSKIFYYLANTTDDLSSIKQMTTTLNMDIAVVNNDNVVYHFDSFEGLSHYALPAHAIPNAIESIFYVYQPISKKVYKETILKLETSPLLFLKEKYKTINELFGIDKKILVNDFKAISAAIEKTKRFTDYEELGKLARKAYPETLLGTYYIARFYEETGEPKRALRTYQSAYVLDEIGGITREDMLYRANLIKQDFGY
ncbi:alpha/beta hydrolase [Algibacter pacificus]|uniref:alpha/beta hydrolase n=1 Tax=Algibacter pacificus TaxID=2599389 RepID=UPI0011C7F19A|nr:alpha/beta hydrolase-fold protein [Algibacter pacificus]